MSDDLFDDIAEFLGWSPPYSSKQVLVVNKCIENAGKVDERILQSIAQESFDPEITVYEMPEEVDEPLLVKE